MDESNKMNRMVKNLLSLDHIESGQNNINIERFNLTELINEICKANELRLDQKILSVYQNARMIFMYGMTNFR